MKTPAADHRRPPFHPHPPTTWMQAGRRKEVSALPNAWSKDVGWSSRRKSLQAGSDFRRELLEYHAKSIEFEGFLAPFWDLGAIWGPKGSRKEKRCKKWLGFGLDLNPFWLHFETWRHFFRSRFSMFFWRCLFHSLGDFWAPMVAKRLPKWSPKGASGYFLGSEKTMVFIVRQAYEGVSGRLWEATFSRLRLQTLSGGVPGSILADFRRLWFSFEIPLGSLWDQKGVQKSCLKKGSPSHMLLGGAGGRGGPHLGTLAGRFCCTGQAE